MFSRGFKDEKDRNIHIARHYSQFLCSAEGCPRQSIGFTSSQGLEKHTEQAHPSSPKPFNLFPSLKPPADISSACKNGNLDALESLVEAGHDLQAYRIINELPPIVIAARHGHFDLCQYLVYKGCSIFKASKNIHEANTALGEAIKSRDTKLFMALLDLATENEAQEFIDGGLFKIHFAAAINFGERDILDVFIRFGAKTEKPLSYPDIFTAAVHFRPRSLNRIGVSSLYEYFFTLPSAIEISLILKQPSPLTGDNSLHVACRSNNRNAVSFLLRRMETGDIYVGNKLGISPFVLAVQYDSIECVQAFFEYDATKSIDTLSNEKYRPLHCACYLGSGEMVKLLLPYSINQLNDQNKGGQTPLHLAISRKRGSNVKVQALLETGAVDLSIRDYSGCTVFDLDTTPETKSLLSAARRWEKVAKSLNDGVSSVESSVRDNEHRTEMGPGMQSLPHTASRQGNVAETPENRASSPASEEADSVFMEIIEPWLEQIDT
ncbi:ankyrin repeat-containing domain protein [Xylaria sp. FL0064]|nr:ankyrin repeat-containing domain protein [Xylaria sp. FL0064]